MKHKKIIKKELILNRFEEYIMYSQEIQLVSTFNYINNYNNGDFSSIILNFSFKDINFNKKRALPFFLALELITNQKCIATLSTKDVFLWKLRRGMLVGCKVTLRNINLTNFFDSLILALPRMEKLAPLNINKLKTNTTKSVSLSLSELILFYPIELGLGVNSEVSKIEVNFLFNTLTKEEKCFLLLSNKIPISF